MPHRGAHDTPPAPLFGRRCPRCLPRPRGTSSSRCRPPSRPFCRRIPARRHSALQHSTLQHSTPRDPARPAAKESTRGDTPCTGAAVDTARAASQEHTRIPLGTELYPPPPPPRTKWTRRVPHPVLIGHAASLSQVYARRGIRACGRPGATKAAHAALRARVWAATDPLLLCVAGHWLFLPRLA
jgi:hypothetical protein